MTSSTFPAAKLLSTQRIDLAIQAMSDSANISHLASENNVSRKFVYQQKNRALEALNDAFAPTTADDEVLFYLPVTKAWLCQVILALTLICRSSCRGVVEFLRDIVGCPSAWAAFTTSIGRPLSAPVRSTERRISRRFVLVCMTKSSKATSPSWPVSMPTRPTAICSPPRITATPTHGLSICYTPVIKASTPTT